MYGVGSSWNEPTDVATYTIYSFPVCESWDIKITMPSWWRWYDALREWPKPTTLRLLSGKLTKPRRCQQPTSLAKRRKQKRRAWLHAIYAR